MIEAIGYEFFRSALVAGLLSSVVCGIIGSYVVVKHMISAAGGISHASFGGIGLGYLLGIDPLAGAFAFTLISSVGMWALMEKAKQHIDTLIGAVWAGGMAFGVLCIALSPGYAPDLFSYLFGNILLVPPEHLLLMACLCLVVIAIVLLLYTGLLAVAFDEEYASIIGLPTRWYTLLLIILIAVAIVVLIRVVGIILVIALLTLPAATARGYCKTLRGMMAISVVFGAMVSTAGICLSYLWDIPSGATIILLLVGVYLASITERYITRGGRPGTVV